MIIEDGSVLQYICRSAAPSSCQMYPGTRLPWAARNNAGGPADLVGEGFDESLGTVLMTHQANGKIDRPKALW